MTFVLSIFFLFFFLDVLEALVILDILGILGELEILVFLFEGTHAEHVNFLLGEEAPIAATEILLGETGKLHAIELNDTIAKALEDTAHDAVLAGMDLNANLRLVVFLGIFDGIGMHLTILQLDTFSNLLHIGSGNVLVEIDVINLLLEELRMRELGSQVTVVGEQEHTRGVAVETAYGIDALRADILHEIHHGLALLRIVAGGDIVLGFIEQHIHFLLQSDGLVMEHHLIGAEHLGAELGNHFPIDLHYACLDELIGLTTAANAGIGEELVQTNGLVGIEVLLLIFYAFLQRILGIGIIAAALLLAITATLLITAALLIATTRLLAVATALLITATLLLAITARLLPIVATTLLLTIASTLLITAARLIAALLFTIIIIAGTIAALLTRLIATLLIIIIVRTIATLLAGLVTSLLARLIAAAGLIATLLRSLRLEISAKTFGAETAFTFVAVRSGRVRTLSVNTRTWRASLLWSIVGIRRAVTFTAILVVLLRRHSIGLFL